MLGKKTNKTWKSNLIIMELSFHYAFDINFTDYQSGDYTIKIKKNNPDVSPLSTRDQVISLN